MGKIEYALYGQHVRLATQPDPRGYRIRWTDPATGTSRDTHRKSWADAEQLANELAGLIQQRISHADGPPRGEASIEELFEDYLAVARARRLLKNQTLKSRKSALMSRVAPVIGEVACRDWTKDITWEAVNALRERGLRDSTVGSTVRSMAAVAAYGEENGYLPAGANPARNIKLHQLYPRL